MNNYYSNLSSRDDRSDNSYSATATNNILLLQQDQDVQDPFQQYRYHMDEEEEEAAAAKLLHQPITDYSDENYNLHSRTSPRLPEMEWSTVTDQSDVASVQRSGENDSIGSSSSSAYEGTALLLPPQQQQQQQQQRDQLGVTMVATAKNNQAYAKSVSPDEETSSSSSSSSSSSAPPPGTAASSDPPKPTAAIAFAESEATTMMLGSAAAADDDSKPTGYQDVVPDANDDNPTPSLSTDSGFNGSATTAYYGTAVTDDTGNSNNNNNLDFATTSGPRETTGSADQSFVASSSFLGSGESDGIGNSRDGDHNNALGLPPQQQQQQQQQRRELSLASLSDENNETDAARLLDEETASSSSSSSSPDYLVCHWQSSMDDRSVVIASTSFSLRRLSENDDHGGILGSSISSTSDEDDDQDFDDDDDDSAALRTTKRYQQRKQEQQRRRDITFVIIAVNETDDEDADFDNGVTSSASSAPSTSSGQADNNGTTVILEVSNFTTLNDSSSHPSSSDDNTTRSSSNETLFQEGSNYTTNLTTADLEPDDEEWDTGNTVVVSNSLIFQSLFGTMLLLILLVRTVMLFFLVKHRKHGAVLLAQPGVMGLLLVAGTFAIGSCFFLIRFHGGDDDVLSDNTFVGDMFCLIREPMILTPLTLAGSILLGRVWRIVLLLTPVLKGLDGDEKLDFATIINRSLLKYLTFWADLYMNIGEFFEGCYYHISTAMKAELHKEPYHVHSDYYARERIKKRRQQAAQSCIRREIPITQLLWLILLLSLPQLILQLCNLLVASWQNRLHVDYTLQLNLDGGNLSTSPAHLLMHNFQEHDFTTVEQWSCQTEKGGAWQTYIGVIMMLMPYISAAILAVNASEDLPKVFNEAVPMRRAVKVIAITAVVALPPLLWLGASCDPDTFVYLTCMLIFAIVMPPCWFIVYPKIWQAIFEDAPSRKALRRMLNMRQDQTETTHSFTAARHPRDDAKSRSATLALTISKMYEEMGQHDQSLGLFRDALAVWQVDPNRDNKDKLGGFTQDELDSLGVSDLECIVQLLIAKGRVHGNHTDANGQLNAAQAWLDALEVYEAAPARAGMTDRTMFFPVFSGLFISVKGGKIQDDDKSTFEQNLARKFVREAKLQGDPIHYSRALAMLCEVKARKGDYQKALETFETLKKIYDPEEHSDAICDAYGSDRSAQAFSQSALWHMQMQNYEGAIKACDHVLENVMFYLDPENLVSMVDMVMPILRVYKNRKGLQKTMRDIWHKFVNAHHEKYYVEKGKTSVASCIVKPMRVFLEVNADPENFENMEDIVEWLMEEEGGVLPDFADTLYTKLCWSCHSMTAELCLRVAQRLSVSNGDPHDTEALVMKAINLCQKTAKKLKGPNNTILYPISNGIHEPLFEEVKGFANSLNIEYITDLTDYSVHGLPPSGSKLDLKNLPHSYRSKMTNSTRSSDRSPGAAIIRTSLVSFATSRSSRSSGRSSDRDSKSDSQSSTERIPTHERFSTTERLIMGDDSSGRQYGDVLVRQNSQRNGRRISFSEISLDSRCVSQFDSTFEDAPNACSDPSLVFNLDDRRSSVAPDPPAFGLEDIPLEDEFDNEDDDLDHNEDEFDNDEDEFANEFSNNEQADKPTPTTNGSNLRSTLRGVENPEEEHPSGSFKSERSDSVSLDPIPLPLEDRFANDAQAEKSEKFTPTTNSTLQDVENPEELEDEGPVTF